MLKIVFFLSLLMSWQIQAYAEDVNIENALQDYQFQDFEIAKDKFEGLLAKDPDNTTIHYYLGLTYEQLQQVDLAIKHLEIVAHSADAPEGIENDLVDLYLQSKQAEKALVYYKPFYMHDKKNGKVALKYASVLLAVGDTSKAKEIYQSFTISDNSFRDEAWYQLGSIYSDYASYGLAVSSFKQVSSKSSYADGAKQYIEALAPVAKPISAYISVEGFYETNPDSTSSSALAGTASTITKVRGSMGSTIIAKLDTGKFEVNEHWRFGLGYLYYGSFYAKQFAKSNNFIGHFLNPVIQWQISPSFGVELQADLQKFNFSQQRLSDNYGGTLTMRNKITDGELSLSFSALEKKYNEAFNSSGTLVSLAYLNATALSSTLSISKDIGKNALTASYTFASEKTHNNQTVTLNKKASDSENMEHTLALADTIHIYDGFDFAVNASYARKNYVNIQSGQAFASIINKTFHVNTTVLGTHFSYAISKKISADLGAEYTKSSTVVSELANVNKRYYLTISGSF